MNRQDPRQSRGASRARARHDPSRAICSIGCTICAPAPNALIASARGGAEDAGTPILFCYLPDLPRLFRFLSALELLQMKGAILCFDFQANALQPLCGDRVELQTIDFAEFERRFFSNP